MKKLLVILLVTAMVLSLAACGGQTTPAQSTTAAQGETAAAAADDQTLTVWCWDPAFNIYAMQEAEKVYQKTNPNFKLNIVETPWNDVQTKVTTASASNDLSTLPDILLMQDNAFQKNVISFPDTLVDITSLGVDFSQFGASKVAYSVVDGKNYGVPFDNGAVIHALRTDVLAEAGLSVADFTDITWDQYIELGKVVLEKTGKPHLSSTAESDLLPMMMQSAGASFFDKDGNPDITNNATLKKVFETYVKLIESGVLIHVNDWDQYIGSMTNATVGGTINGCWIIGSIQTAQDQSGKWAITNMPKLDGIPTATNYANNGGSSWAATANSKNPQLAADFLAKTFAGSVEFYETILPASGALASYAPAGRSTVYSQPQEFFGNQPIYALITEFAGKVPSNYTGAYYYEARDALAAALTNSVSGASIDDELKTAEDIVKTAMGQ